MEMTKTKKLYDADAYQTEFDAIVLSCEEVQVEKLCEEMIYAVTLDQTVFFPEEGGQTPDKGSMNGIEVLDVQIKGNVITHYLRKPVQQGDHVHGKIDWQHRFFNMQQHSAEHIFSGTAYRKYGYSNVGFHLSNQIVTMDFDGTFTPEQLLEMEWEVNQAIVANVEIKTGYPEKEVLEKLEYRSKLALLEDIRIVEVDGYDVCACCAPHVHRTGEIGMFKIQSAQSYKGGVRISFLAGFRALEEYRRKSEIISELSGILTTNQENLADHVAKLKSQVYSLKNELSNTKQTLMEMKMTEIPAEQKDVFLFEQDLESADMRNVVNKLMEIHEGICGIFVGSDETGYNFIIGSKTVNCCDTATLLRTELNARGGGKPQMIQGSLVARQEEIQKILKSE